MASDSFYKSALFNRLLEGKLSSQDIDELITWLGNKDIDPEAAALIMQQLQQPVTAEQVTPEIRAALEARLPVILMQHRRKYSSLRATSISNNWLRLAAAIIVLFGVGVLIMVYRQSAKKQPVVSNAPAKNDIMPGKTGATLTLTDGSTVVLDSLGQGLIATQNGSRIILNNGQLAYQPDAVTPAEPGYNMITTPRGRQFQLLLPDGSKVWLNAASSLRYPTAFTGKERNVEVTGEAYFEVAKNAAMPFRVKVNDKTTIEVLGTHFNINAYENEGSVKTTLIEGRVKVISAIGRRQSAILKPGEQAVLTADSRLTTHDSRLTIDGSVDLDAVMAWKNGVFNFQDATLEEVMRQLERWYDIEVAYEKGVPRLEFIGKMGRDLKLSEVLRGLEVSKVHFRVEGRKLVVLP